MHHLFLCLEEDEEEHYEGRGCSRALWAKTPITLLLYKAMKVRNSTIYLSNR